MTIDSLLITGPPAAGKTLIRRAILETVSALHTVNTVAIDETLRQMVAQHDLDEECAYIDEDDALILLQPQRTVPLVLRRMLMAWSSSEQPVIVEAPLQRDFLRAFLENRALAKRSAVIYANAPVCERLRRNSNRGRDRISEQGLRAMDHEIDRDLLDRIRREAGALHLANTMAEPGDVVTSCLRFLSGSALLGDPGA